MIWIEFPNACFGNSRLAAQIRFNSELPKMFFNIEPAPDIHCTQVGQENPSQMNFRLGYLVPEFPGQTHVFFWREVEALRQRGVKVHLISTKRPVPVICRHTFAKEALTETHYLYPPRFLDLLIGTLRNRRKWGRPGDISARFVIDNQWSDVGALRSPLSTLSNGRAGIKSSTFMDNRALILLTFLRLLMPSADSVQPYAPWWP